MAWFPYFEYASTEIINAERVEQYARHEPWFHAVYNARAIGELYGQTYDTPQSDPAPWVDPDDPDTFGFYGVYPLNITGFEDSTRTSDLQEATGHGGSVGTLRFASRAVVYECALFGDSECAVEKGLTWLRKALTADTCGQGSCDNGEDLCYFACEPCPHNCSGDQPCRDESHRTLRGVAFNSGPTVTARRTASNGGAVWVVTFTGVTGTPWEYGPEELIVEDFGSGSDPWVPSIVPADWLYDDVGEQLDDSTYNCSVQVYDPLVDPLCPAVELPPEPPPIPLACWESPTLWTRRWFTIPRKYVPYWGDVIPNLTIQTLGTEVRGLRVRFYSDLDADGSVLEDPCNFCGDLVFTYIPPETTMTLDGTTQTAQAEQIGGVVRRADTLIVADDGSPFDWPLLTCGLGYVVSVDVPEDFAGEFPLIDLSLRPRVAA